MESENRKLIKFSNYSLCVTLPKRVIKELKWEKGDIIKMSVDEKKGEILITKGSGPKKLADNKSSTAKSPKTKPSKKSRW